MQQTMRPTAALEPRRHSTSPDGRVARGYHPTQEPTFARAATAVLRALRAIARATRAQHRPYSDGELFIAFLTGVVLAACAAIPFLPRLAH